jgi:hypothetical protein
VNEKEINDILLRHRAGIDPAEEKEAALRALGKSDPEWLSTHAATQAAIREKLRTLPIPPDLKSRILKAEDKIIRPVFWQRRAPWLAAAACAALLAVAVMFSKGSGPGLFAQCRDRVVRTAIREYRMDVRTSDEARVREYMRSRGAPADYVVPHKLESLALTGGGLLRWHGHPVSMLCYDRGDKEMVFLFVLERTAVKDAPPEQVQFQGVSNLKTASWSSGNRTYVLAAPEGEPVEKYL